MQAGFYGRIRPREVRINNYIRNPCRLLPGPDPTWQPYVGPEMQLRASDSQTVEFFCWPVPDVVANETLNFLIDQPERTQIPIQAFTDSLKDFRRSLP